MWMTMECSTGSGCRDLNIHNSRDLPDNSIKPANLQPAVLLTPKLISISNTTQNPALPCNHHQQQMVQVTTSQPSRNSRDCVYIDKQPAPAAPSRGSRWNPTPEQLMTLEELYRTGLKTPTAQQIRRLTAQLRNFGRIECKNVFYWFQNHRARERQKRRRQLMSMYQSDSKQQEQSSLTNNTISGLQDKESAGGLTKSSLEVEQQNKWKLPNCSVLSNQESSSVLQERMMSMVKSTSSKQLVEQPDSPRPTSDTNAPATLSCTKFLNFHNYYDYDCGMVLAAPNVYKGEEESRETQTLELFPLKSDNVKGAKETKCISRTTSTDVASANFMPADDIVNFFEQIKAAYN